jgi:hypothetical protein
MRFHCPQENILMENSVLAACTIILFAILIYKSQQSYRRISLTNPLKIQIFVCLCGHKTSLFLTKNHLLMI